MQELKRIKRATTKDIFRILEFWRRQWNPTVGLQVNAQSIVQWEIVPNYVDVQKKEEPLDQQGVWSPKGPDVRGADKRICGQNRGGQTMSEDLRQAATEEVRSEHWWQKFWIWCNRRDGEMEMKYCILKKQDAAPTDFVEFWAKMYNYGNETTYDEFIGHLRSMVLECKWNTRAR